MSETTGKKKNKGKEKNKLVNNKQEIDKNGGNLKGNQIRPSGGNEATPPVEKSTLKANQAPKEPITNIKEPEGPTNVRSGGNRITPPIEKGTLKANQASKELITNIKEPERPRNTQEQNQMPSSKSEKQKNQPKCKCEAYRIEMNSYRAKVGKLEKVIQDKVKELECKDLELKEKVKELEETRRECGKLGEKLEVEQELTKSLRASMQAPARPVQDQQRSVQNAEKTPDRDTSPVSDSVSEIVGEDTSQQNAKNWDSWDNGAGDSSAGVDGPDGGSRAWCDEVVPELEDTRKRFGRNFALHRTGPRPRELSNQDVGRGGSSHQNYKTSFISSSRPRWSLAGSAPDTSKTVREVQGDLFLAPQGVALAHCVAADLAMSSGVAVDFRWRFRKVGELLEQRKGVGEVAFLKVEGRWVYYMITKLFSTGKPRMQDVVRALEGVRDHAVADRVTEVAMPRIGCGLDRLDWKQVKQAIARTFSDTSIKITIYNLQEESSQLPMKRNVHVTHAKYPLVGIASCTGLLFFGSADGEIASTSLFAKYESALNEFSKAPRRVGDVVRITPPAGDYLYGLVVKERKSDRLSYLHLEECMKQLKKHLTADRYEYVGLEAFLDGEDPLTTDKVLNVLRNGINPGSKYKISIYVCWPDHLAHHHKFEDEPLASMK